jgi:hypothetical protein
MSRFALVLASLLPILAATPLDAQGGRIVASVVEAETGAPIVGAELVVPALRRSAWADDEGDVTLASIPPGDYDVRIRHLGHAPAELKLRVGDKPVGAMVILERRVVGLDTIRVTGRYVPFDAPIEFRQRQALGLGRFLTDRDLAPEGDRDFATVMSTKFPGLRASGEGSSRCIANGRFRATLNRDVFSNGMGCNGCRLRVFLDDIEISSDLWIVRTWDLVGVEYYTPGTTPARYNNGRPGGCGVLVLWSKK